MWYNVEVYDLIQQKYYFKGLMYDCSISSALAMEML